MHGMFWVLAVRCCPQNYCVTHVCSNPKGSPRWHCKWHPKVLGTFSSLFYHKLLVSEVDSSFFKCINQYRMITIVGIQFRKVLMTSTSVCLRVWTKYNLFWYFQDIHTKGKAIFKMGKDLFLIDTRCQLNNTIPKLFKEHGYEVKVSFRC